MDFDQFKIQVVDEMRERFPNLDIGIQAVSKLQGESYTGLAVSPAGSNVAATMNLDYVYKRVEDGMPMETALHNIEKQVAEIAGSMPQFDTRALMDYDQMKEKLTLQMIPIAGNEEKLSEIPHRAVEDMALVYRFEMESNEQGSASILVTNNMLQTYDITANQLHSDALEAALENHPATLRNMNEVLRDMMGDAAGMFLPDEPSPIWVATVEGGQNGACTIQYPDFLDQAAETMGGDFYVLPSSIHEVLFIADDGSMELSHLEEMVRSINEAEVAPADRLSDNVFHYDSEEHIFENARTFEARDAARVEAMLADEPAGFMEADTITMLKKHIINYSKTRVTYEEYRKVGYSKKFLEAHREEITIHKAAKAAFDELGVRKLPRVKNLSIEYAEVLAAKKQTYAEYRLAKSDAQELLIAQQNIASLYDAERKEEEQKRRKEEQSH